MIMKALKLIINLIFLTISISLSAYFMIHLTNNTYIRIGLVIFVLNLEVAMQYILALGKQKYNKHKVQAVLLFICYAAYVFIYNVPSGVGFFLAEMDIQDKVYYQNETLEKQNQVRLKEIEKTMANLNRQLETEAETGFGNRSKSIMEQMDKLLKEREKLFEVLSKVPEVQEVTKNPFQSLSKVLKVRSNVLAAIIFGTSMLMLCTILIITSWDLPGEALEVEDDEFVTETIPIVDDKEELITYVDAAIRDTGKLNGNPRIMELTGIPLNQCVKFRNWLTKLKIDGVPAVTIKQGGGDINLPKQDILKAIEGV